MTRYALVPLAFLLHTEIQQYIEALTRGRSKTNDDSDIVTDINDPRNGLFLYLPTHTSLDAANFAILRVSRLVNRSSQCD